MLSFKRCNYFTGMSISLPFLIVTFLIYAIVPELRSLHGKNLMYYIFCLTVYYTLILVSSSHDVRERSLCTTIGYLIYYFGLATFCWLNVICIEIYTKIVFVYTRGGRSSDSKLLIIFCVYGFGAPIILSVLMFLLDKTPIGYFINELYLPKIGQDQSDGAYECFVQSGF